MTSAIIDFFVAINLLTLVVSLFDKRLAVHKMRRFPESLMLWMSFCGGAAGAKAAQIISGHKTLKVDFTASLNLIVFLQLGIASAVWSQKLRNDGIVVSDILLASFESEKAEEPSITPRRFGPGS